MTNENNEMPDRIEFRLRRNETEFLKRLMEQARRFNRCPNEQPQHLLPRTHRRQGDTETGKR